MRLYKCTFKFSQVYNLPIISEYFFIFFSFKIFLSSSLIFTAILLAGVYAYAVYATSKGLTEDENQNYIPDSWEKNFKWLFSGKVIIMFLLGLAIGYLFATV